MPVARTDGRTYGHVITRISGIGRLPHFLRYGATLARAPERGDPLKRWIVVIACSDWLLNLRIFTDLPPAPPSEPRQTRGSYEQNGFSVCCRKRQKFLTSNKS